MTQNPTKLFIRGGQLFLHNVRMFTQVGKKVAVAMLLAQAILVGSFFMLNTSAYQRYLGFVYVKAELTLLIDYKAKLAVIMPTGEAYSLFCERIVNASMINKNNQELLEGLLVSLIESLLSSVAVLVFIVRWLQKRGENQSKSKVIRGSALVESSELQQAIKKSKKVSPYPVAGIYLPKGSETQHIQMVGTTGAGKTVAIRELLSIIRDRGERAIIYDKGGTYLSKFYQEGKDILLNPLDARGRAWDVWAECEDKADFEALAEALMPMPINNTMDPFWVNAARMIFVSTANELKKNPNRSNIMLLQYLLTADLGKIHELLKHTESESLVSSKIQKTALNVKTVMATYLKSLLYLQDQGEAFSIRNWILNENQSSCLFVSSDGRKHPTLRPLISAWLNTATKEILGLPADDNRRVWLILDELATLHALPFLETVKSESRKFGGCFILGHHGPSQLRKIYGREGASVLSNLCSTRLYLRLPEHEDADAASLNIGTYEIEEAHESVSYGANTMRDGISVSRQTKEKRLVLPSQIQELDDLEGYLRVKGRLPRAQVQLKYVDYPIKNPEFIGREIDPDPLRQNVELLVDMYSDPILAGAHDEALSESKEKPVSKELEEKEVIQFL
jgi:type IV conjugative transfer system coupling protein TraD